MPRLEWRGSWGRDLRDPRHKKLAGGLSSADRAAIEEVARTLRDAGFASFSPPDFHAC